MLPITTLHVLEKYTKCTSRCGIGSGDTHAVATVGLADEHMQHRYWKHTGSARRPYLRHATTMPVYQTPVHALSANYILPPSQHHVRRSRTTPRRPGLDHQAGGSPWSASLATRSPTAAAAAPQRHAGDRNREAASSEPEKLRRRVDFGCFVRVCERVTYRRFTVRCLPISPYLPVIIISSDPARVCYSV